MASENFKYLDREFPILFNLAQAAEYNLYSDPPVAMFKLRAFGEKLSEIIFQKHGISFPYENTFHNRLKTLEFEGVLPDQIKDLLFLIKNKGNVAVHNNKGTFEDAKQLLQGAFKVSVWFYETYSLTGKDLNNHSFVLPNNLDTRHALHVLETDYKELETKFNKLLQEKKEAPLTSEALNEVKKRSIKSANKIQMSEADTRDLIDAQLRAAGWEVNTLELNYKKNKTVPVRGKNIAIAEWPAAGLWADYALFIGLDLVGIVEAKKYAQDISTDLGQAKVYAEVVEPTYKIKFTGEWGKYKVPFLFSTNGRPYLKQLETKSGIWFLDVRNPRNISRSLQAWYSPEGLKKLLEQDIDLANEKLNNTVNDFLESKNGLGLRKYQTDAIKAVENVLVNDPNRRKALIAMATGTGKTRTIIGLCYKLIQTNRFKRILFLVDRTLLGIQAINAFKDNKVIDLNTFADVYNIKELSEALPDVDTRLQFATVQGMVKRVLYNDENSDKPTVDAYDCIIVDEAHRGYLLDKEIGEDDLSFKDQRDYVSKYRTIIEYFDAFAVGLTATPALHTTEIFGLPIYSYSYREAVIDGYLIDHDPPYNIKTKLSEEGIIWEKGSKPKAYDKETNSIIELAELQDELSIDIAGFNKLVLTESFNRTVVKELAKEIDPEGEEKTLVFAATDEHADLLVKLFKEEYIAIGVEVSDDAIQKITGKSYDPEEQVKRFKNETFPNIVVTVDLLTTGIDIPSICNLVFMRRVKSRILYEQMLGRATRRCDDIGKEVFRIYDAVRIYETLEEYTQMKPVTQNPTATFTQLVEEFKNIDNNDRAKKQLEQIIAKLQRKKKKIKDTDEEKFKYFTQGKDPESFINLLKGIKSQEKISDIIQLTGLWKFLDELKSDPAIQFWSEHKDEFYGMDRGYGRGQKPEDYLEGFKKYIIENQNKITALSIICTRPKELDRKSLKELLLVLDQQGYNTRFLHAAWKDAKNEDIAADIIGYIRTLALGNVLISHEDRISHAINQVKEMREWNKTQLNWLERFEKQLLAETVLRVEDLNESPFKDKGGFKQLDKVFENKLQELIDIINENLYKITA